MLLTFGRPHLAVVSLAVTACSGGVAAAAAGAPAVPATYVYTCSGGERFLARFQSDSAMIEVAPHVYRLPQVIAASGARYEADGIEFWTKGLGARLVAAGVEYGECTGTRADTPWDAARLMGYDFRAVGQEPGWALEIDEDGRSLSYVGDYGSTRFVMQLPQPAHDSAGNITYDARSAVHELTIRIRETPCQDVMSGEPFTHTVLLVVDGRELHGCGRAT